MQIESTTEGPDGKGYTRSSVPVATLWEGRTLAGVGEDARGGSLVGSGADDDVAGARQRVTAARPVSD